MQRPLDITDSESDACLLLLLPLWHCALWAYVTGREKGHDEQGTSRNQSWQVKKAAEKMTEYVLMVFNCDAKQKVYGPRQIQKLTATADIALAVTGINPL